MSSLHNDLETWANKARLNGQDTIYINLETAYKISGCLMELEDLRDTVRNFLATVESRTNSP